MGLPSILLNSRSRAAEAIVFSEPDLALDPASRVRRSRCSPPPQPFRAASLLILRRDTRPQRPEPSALIAGCGEDKGRSPTPVPRQENVL